MKVLLIATLLMSLAYANKEEETVAQIKTKIATNIDQKIALMQSHKSCIQAANDHVGLKACRETHKEAMKKLHVENKGERAGWKAGKEGRKDKRKAEKTN